MRFATRSFRLSSLAFATALSGCVNQPNPHSATVDRALPPPPALTERAEASAPKQIAEQNELTTASSTAPALSSTPVLTSEEAVLFALQNNPTLMSVRLQRGFAAGGVVIAKTYPFNPIAENFEQAVMGPQSSGITNKAFTQSTIRLDLELRGQGKHRRSAADAVVSRTEWEIATQELAISVATSRAFNTVIYRRRKLDVLEDTVKLDELIAGEVKKLVDLGRFRPADLFVVQTELDTARAQLGQGKVALAVARADLRRQLGILDDTFEVKGELNLPVPPTNPEVYLREALVHRPDLQARRAAVTEAQARLRLQKADRYGNISVGPSYQFDDTSASYIGAAVFIPIPVLNTHRGEIMQAEATVARSIADVKQMEVQTEQELQAALIHLIEARKWAENYTTDVLPNLRKATESIKKLLEQNDPGVDVIKVIDVQRNYLRAFDAYLDALYEMTQGRADLAAAVGDPILAFGLRTPQNPAPKTVPDPIVPEPPKK